MIVFSDLHLREESARSCFKVLARVGELAMRDDQTIVCCGDFWHLRYRLDVRLLNAVADVVRGWCSRGFVVHFVPGNHDQVDVEGQNALQVLQGHGAKVWTAPGWAGTCGFVPYRKDPDQQMVELRGVCRTLGVAVVFAHFGVRGATMNAGRADTDGVPLGDLPSEGPYLVLGHYHKAQEGPGWRYVGSPYQVDFGEAGNACGVLRVTVLESRKVECQRIGLEDLGLPRHYTVVWRPEDGKLPPRPGGPGDRVRIDIQADPTRLAKLKVDLERQGYGDAQVNVVATPEVREQRFALGEGESLLAAAKRFAAEQPEVPDGALMALNRYAEGAGGDP